MGNIEKIDVIDVQLNYAYTGELMLLGWSDTSARGRTVTFLVPEDEPEHPFKTFNLKKGKTTGTRFAAVMMVIEDDETVKPKTTSQEAAALCKQPRFWHWCSEHSFDTVTSEQGARAFILTLCKIDSRSELDRDPSAERVFRWQILKPYNEYISITEAQL